jgi:hypothetical protein
MTGCGPVKSVFRRHTTPGDRCPRKKHSSEDTFPRDTIISLFPRGDIMGDRDPASFPKTHSCLSLPVLPGDPVIAIWGYSKTARAMCMKRTQAGFFFFLKPSPDPCCRLPRVVRYNSRQRGEQGLPSPWLLHRATSVPPFPGVAPLFSRHQVAGHLPE